jgi:hypothetical protein
LAEGERGRLRILDRETRLAFLSLALPEGVLRRACSKLGLSFPGYRLESIPAADLARALTEEYESDPRASQIIDRQIEEECVLPLEIPGRFLTPGLVELLVQVGGSPPLVVAPLLWSVFGHRAAGVREAGVEAFENYLDQLFENFEIDADSAKGRERRAGGSGLPASPARGTLHRRLKEAEVRASALERDLVEVRGHLARDRQVSAQKDAKLAQLKADLASARERQRQADEALVSRERMQDVDALEAARLKAAEAERLSRQLADVQYDLQSARRREAELTTLVRAREAPAPAAPAAPVEARPAPRPSAFLVPVFTEEFYGSLEGWEARVVRAAFEKALLLCQNFAHPGIDAKAIQGADGLYRIFVAQDVRLFYRRPPGGRIEILSLIDREDLDRYIRQYKSRTGV